MLGPRANRGPGHDRQPPAWLTEGGETPPRSRRKTYLPPASPEESNHGLRALFPKLEFIRLIQLFPRPPSLVMMIVLHSSPSLPPLPTGRTALAGKRGDAVRADHRQRATTGEDATLTGHGGGKPRGLLLQRRPTSSTATPFTAPLLNLQTTDLPCKANPSQEASCCGRVRGAERQLTDEGREAGSGSALSALSPGFQLRVPAGAPLRRSSLGGLNQPEEPGAGRAAGRSRAEG